MGVVVVTGASRGIGAEVARQAAIAGHDVALTFHRRGDQAEAVADECRTVGVRALVVPTDLSVEGDIERLFRRVDDGLGPLTALVNNAGILEPQMRVDVMSAERLERVFRVNVIGSFLCAREAIRRMSTATGGSGGVIVNLSSAASRLGSPNEYVDYASSKGAIDTFTLGLAKEVGADDIRVNAVRPGPIDTEIHASGGEPDRVARIASSIPLGRGGEVHEVAAAILWLISDEASYVSGALLDVAGGI
jgi:NAD(P)-dependent dehydrogenase (short-subunit alcohol dehydrogenase family)